MSKEDWEEFNTLMILRYRKGRPEAVGQFLEANKNLAACVALRFGFKPEHTGSWDDAIQAAYVGIWKAMVEHDFARGSCVSTTITWKAIAEVSHLAKRRRAVKEVPEADLHSTSYDRPEWDGDRYCNLDQIETANQEADSGLLALDMTAKARDAMEFLGERERYVIEARMGLAGRKEMTLKQVAAVLGITKERVRQIESIAIGRMRWHLARRGAESGVVA